MQNLRTYGASATQGALEQQARRMAKRLDLGLRKFRPNARFSDTYGPYLLFNPYSNGVVEYGFQTIEEVIDYLDGELGMKLTMQRGAR